MLFSERNSNEIVLSFCVSFGGNDYIGKYMGQKALNNADTHAHMHSATFAYNVSKP